MKTSATVFYEYLLENPGRFVTQEELCRALPEHFPYIEPKNGTTLNRKFGHVVDFINESVEDFPIVVVTKKRSYKLATKKEAKTFLKNEWRKVNNKIGRLLSFGKKLNLDSQADLQSLIYGDELTFRETVISEDSAHE